MGMNLDIVDGKVDVVEGNTRCEGKDCVDGADAEIVGVDTRHSKECSYANGCNNYYKAVISALCSNQSTKSMKNTNNPNQISFNAVPRVLSFFSFFSGEPNPFYSFPSSLLRPDDSPSSLFRRATFRAPLLIDVPIFPMMILDRRLFDDLVDVGDKGESSFVGDVGDVGNGGLPSLLIDVPNFPMILDCLLFDDLVDFGDKGGSSVVGDGGDGRNGSRGLSRLM